MITINDIPYNKYYKLKVQIPKNGEETKPGYGCLAILNNRSLDDSLKIFNNPILITNNSKYFYFYLDRIYRETIHTKTYKINDNKKREEDYEKIKTKLRTVKTPLNMSVITNKNCYYDMYRYNELFFKSVKSVNIKRRIEIYFKLINKIINKPEFDDYSSKVMYIDVESWLTDKENIDNIISYMLISYKKFPELLELLDPIDIIIYSNSGILKINSKEINKETFFRFKTELTKMTSKLKNIDDNIDTVLKNDNIKSNVIKTTQSVSIKSDINDDEEKVKNIIGDSIKPERYSFVGDTDNDDADIDIDEKIDNDETDADTISDDDEFNDKLDEKIDDELTKINNEDPNLTSDEVAERIKANLNSDKELVSSLHDTIQKKKTGKSTASLKRDEELRKKQKMIKIEERNLDDYVKVNAKTKTISVNDVSTKVATTNENVKKVRFTNFEKTYNDELMKSDTVKIIENLNNMSIPAYVVKFDIKDSSDELNYKDTYHIILEDENRIRHSLTFDVPKFVDDRFLYINGNKKVIQKQLFPKPISKTAPDTVQICSNYNKIFIYRQGSKISPKIEKFKKAITIPIFGMKIVNGDNRKTNNMYKTTLEYDTLAATIVSIKLKDCEIIFNQDEVYNRLGKNKLKTNDFCIGFYNDGTPIIMNFENEKIDGKYDIIDFIVEHSPEKFKTNFNEMKAGTTRFSYSRAVIMSKSVPIILLLGYCEGISTVLKKANIKHYFTDKRPQISDNEAVIRFADGYLVYDRYPYENSLLLNALNFVPTSSIEYDEFNNKEVYVELFYEMFKARNLANAFDSFYEFMIDPITKEILEDLDYPTDFVSVVLTANALLADNSYIPENNMNLYRIRSNEIVNGIIHKSIADAYSKYRASANNTSPVKISIPKDAIIKEILKVPTVEDFSTLNPIYETEKMSSISPKGYRGMNSERAFTVDKRSYDESMLGILGISTAYDGNVGITRKLTNEPNVVGPRGYINIEDDETKLKDVNLFTATEMLTPMGVTHDDSIRTAMASRQSSHIIPVAKSSPVLVSNGMEQTIQYNLSKDFVIIAEDDGEVVEYNEDVGLVVVQYKNGKSQAIDIKPKVVKNSSSGFYISNKLKCDLKLGDKVKKNDIIGYDEKFFTNDNHNGNRFNLGSLHKIAIMSGYATFEDSTFVTRKMSENMASEIVMMSSAIIGKNSNVGKIVNVGDEVHAGDTLVEYDTSFDDDGINKFLSTIGDDMKEEIKSLSRTPIKSKYSGVVEDIKIYTTVDTEDLSPSLQKIIKSYYARINKKKKTLEKYDNSEGIVKAGVLFTEATDKLKPAADGTIKGNKVFDGVLIEFYIKYFDPISVGDKITFYSALKSIVGEVIEEGYEPYSEFRPDEEISTFLGPSAVLARMVPSSMLVMFTNKVLIELKRTLNDIYEK